MFFYDIYCGYFKIIVVTLLNTFIINIMTIIILMIQIKWTLMMVVAMVVMASGFNTDSNGRNCSCCIDDY